MALSKPIPVAFFNYQTNTMHHVEVPITSTADEVTEILNPLEAMFPGSYVTLNNQLTQLQEDDIIADVYREGDVLSAIKMRHMISRDGVRWPDRPSGDVVVFFDKKKNPIFFEPKNVEQWKWFETEFSQYIAVFRRQYTDDNKREAEKEEGEIVYIGHKYHVKKGDDRNLSLEINRQGVYRVAGGVKEEIPASKGGPIKKLDGLFYKPVGPNLTITFENQGPETHILLGDKFSFQSIKLVRGEEKEFEIQPDFRANHVFGLSSDGNGVMEVNMYSIVHGGKRVRLGEDGSVTLVNNQDKEERMNCSEMKIYKDEDQNEMKNLLRSINPDILAG